MELLVPIFNQGESYQSYCPLDINTNLYM